MNVLFIGQKRKAKKEVGFAMDVPTVPRVGEHLDLGKDKQGTVQGVVWTFRSNGSKADAIIIFK